jgi:hypothetical protein
LLGLRALRQIEEKLGARLEFQVLFHETLADIAMRFRTRQMARPEEHGGVVMPAAH